MRLRQTNIVMQHLRAKSRLIRPNNPRINEWVDDYLNQCALQGKPIGILTQLCISKDLEVRYQEQGGAFTPTKKEYLLFAKEIPQIARIFRENGFAIDWWITLNQSYLDSGRISDALRLAYAFMIGQLAQPLIGEGWLMVADWEDDVMAGRSAENREVAADLNRFVPPDALSLEIQRHTSWARDEAGLIQTDEAIRRDVYFQIACEAEEGRLLSSPDSPVGECLLIPLEAPERYDFFTLLAPDFKKRIAAMLPTYPWRLRQE